LKRGRRHFRDRRVDHRDVHSRDLRVRCAAVAARAGLAPAGQGDRPPVAHLHGADPPQAVTDTVNVDTLVAEIERWLLYEWESTARKKLSDLAARARLADERGGTILTLVDDFRAEHARAEAAEADRDQLTENLRLSREAHWADRDRLARRVAELEQVCEKAIRERRSLESKEDDWHSAYERSERRVAELEAALRETLNLAAVSTEGDPWYAEDAGIDAEAVL